MKEKLQQTKNSRRDFIKTVGKTAVVAPAATSLILNASKANAGDFPIPCASGAPTRDCWEEED